MPKDTIIQKNNFTKQYGTLRPNMLDTVKEKEYYLEQQGNSFSLQFPLRFQMTSDAVLLLCTKLFIDNAKSQILLTDITYDNLGRRIYCYGQYYNGIRVRGRAFKNVREFIWYN
jgi:Zn-dependent metalloprotease